MEKVEDVFPDENEIVNEVKGRKQNEVTNFMHYIYNKWSADEAVTLFGFDLGYHIWDKYVHCGNAVLMWYAELDEKCKQALVDRANDIYGKMM